MDKSQYKVIIDAFLKELSPKGFKNVKDDTMEYISDGKRAYTIEYDEASKLLTLKSAVLEEGEGVDFVKASEWLLDENSDDKDKKSIANDFIDTALTQIGAKATSGAVSNTKIDMPSKKRNAETIDIESFTARFLAAYPDYKNDYKESIAKYGEFLYDTFYSEFGVKVFEDIMKNGNQKQVTKCLDLLSTCYNGGEKEVSTTIVYTIISGALMDNQELMKKTLDYMMKYPYLYKATNNMFKLLSKESNKKRYL